MRPRTPHALSNKPAAEKGKKRQEHNQLFLLYAHAENTPTIPSNRVSTHGHNPATVLCANGVPNAENDPDMP
jgi:hypothetical protein